MLVAAWLKPEQGSETTGVLAFHKGRPQNFHLQISPQVILVAGTHPGLTWKIGILVSISFFYMRKKCSLLPCPLLVMDAPRLCLQQKVKPPRFARRLPESPTDCGFSGQGIF